MAQDINELERQESPAQAGRAAQNASPQDRPEPPAGYDGSPAAEPQSLAEAARATMEAVPGLADVNVRSVKAVGPGPHRGSLLSFIPTTIKLIPALFVVLIGLVTQMPDMLSSGETLAGGLLTMLLPLLGLLVLVVGIALLTWYINTWELADDALVLRKKFITSSEKRIPYQRIHSIDLSAKIFERLLGLVSVSVDTGTGVSSKIEGMRRDDAEALKRIVFARKELLAKGVDAAEVAAMSVDDVLDRAEGAQVGGEVAAAVRGAAVASAGDAQVAGERAADTCGVVESDRVDHEARLTGRQYVIGAITSPTINGLILTFFGFTAGMWQLVDYAADIFGDRLVYGIVGSGAQITADAAGGIASTAGSMIALMAAVVFLVILLVVWIASAALSLVKWGNFVARRRGERIEVSWGLLSRSTRAVELSRVQVVRVHQSLIRRLSGYAQIVVHTVGAGAQAEGQESASTGVVVHPCIKLREVDAWLADMLPEFAGVCEAAPSLDRLPAQALRRTLLRGVYWTAFVAVTALAVTLVVRRVGPLGETQPFADVTVWALWALAALVLVWGSFVRVLGWRLRRVGTGGDDRLLITRSGALQRTVSAVSRTKLQSVTTSQTPFQRRARVATLITRTACVSATYDPGMRDVSVQTADRLLAWARPRYHNEEEVARALAEAGIA